MRRLFWFFSVLAFPTLIIALAAESSSPIRFVPQLLPYNLASGETERRHLPATMAGGIGVFDYDGDGRPDIFLANGADLETLRKDDPKYENHLLHNEGNGQFRDVTKQAGLTGTGFDIGVAAADFDNDGHPDLFVAGLYKNTLYHNNGDGTFTDVTEKAGLAEPGGKRFAVAAAWVDVNNDGLLDLFIANYVQWDYKTDPPCSYTGQSEYCHPNMYQGSSDQLFLNKGNGKFEDVSATWGLTGHVGKGMGVGVADFDLDGKPDIFVTNDTYYNSFFHNLGNKFEEVALDKGVALVEDGNFISGMGIDFRDYNNDGYPDIFFVALQTHTFPLFRNDAGKGFTEVTAPSGLREESSAMAGWGAGFYDLDNDGWKDIFVTRGDVLSLPLYHTEIDQPNTVFRNLGKSGKFQALTAEAGLNSEPGRHRGLAFGDFDGDGRVDVVTTSIGKPAAIWMNRSQGGHWLDIELQGTRSNRDGIGARIEVTSATVGKQFNHMTSSVGYASSSYGPVHFGLGPDAKATEVKILWPAGTATLLKDVAADQKLHVKEGK